MKVYYCEKCNKIFTLEEAVRNHRKCDVKVLMDKTYNILENVKALNDVLYNPIMVDDNNCFYMIVGSIEDRYIVTLEKYNQVIKDYINSKA